MAGGALATAIDSLAAAVDALLGCELSVEAAPELAESFARLEVQRRRLVAVDHRLVAELRERGIAGEYGRTGTADLLCELTRISPAEATARVRAADDLGPRREVSGARLAPLFARVADAQREGAISVEHARVIRTTVAALPDKASFELAGPVEQFLADQARHLDPKHLGAVAQRLLATIDPDGAAPSEEEQQRRRDLTLTRTTTGVGRVDGLVTDECVAVWTPILNSLAAPQPGVDGTPDPRTPGQRRHDALLEAGRRLLRSGTLPDCGGLPTAVTLSLRAEDLDHGSGVAVTDTGDPISWTAAMRLIDQCELFTTVFDRHGAILAAGRTARCANRTQRRALAARDGGCCFPGCTRPAAWCEAHHVIPWLAGGRTDIDNLVLLCGFHHREFERQGWLVRMTDGVPEWIPPPWLDPAQTPRRNTAHHLPEFDFTTTGASPARGP